MNIEDMTIGQARQIAAFFTVQTGTSKEPFAQGFVGRHVVLRTYTDGVHIGTVKAVSDDGRQVILSDSRRLYSWSGAFTLSAVAMSGVDKSSRLAISVPELIVTECISMTPTTQEARDKFDAIS